MKNSNFGSYAVPPTLQKLIRLKEEWGGHDPFYTGLNFYLELSSFRYFNTPCDVVVFGNNGGDGIHYGFLTDFGTVDHLEHAPVVCVSPMDFDRPTKIIANDIKEFLSLLLTDEELFYNVFATEEDYRAAKQRWKEEAAVSPYGPTEEEQQQREDIRRTLRERVSLPHVENPYRHLELLARQRQERIAAGTQDLLGVVSSLAEDEVHVPYYVHKDERLDIEELKVYMVSAPAISKKALIRDIQMNFILRDEDELCKIVIQALTSLDLIDEVKRIAEGE
ncbi:hypothetical protein D3P07_21640 [Paenibacillus sp. 1011MAR3C5]|uniref:hypothetical protein n=1 Tax=Paenibacillus sp. 1011MAR3C5 TaxID=1675787 RepID=UPI000E6CFDA1|nr:hypothetical protein [Paenibacillus sp. 1011MAR3C5]RJE85174.1 hypothetical protein D3P07_21640 [Paenibacillus sp. 1011MAR3C5]